MQSSDVQLPALRTEAEKLRRLRLWTWILCHPDHKDETVHQTRSVHCFCVIRLKVFTRWWRLCLVYVPMTMIKWFPECFPEWTLPRCRILGRGQRTWEPSSEAQWHQTDIQQEPSSASKSVLICIPSVGYLLSCKVLHFQLLRLLLIRDHEFW